MINFSIIIGQSNVAFVAPGLRDLLIAEFGEDDSELLAVFQNSTSIFAWSPNFSNCAQTQLLQGHLQTVVDRVNELGPDDVTFDSIYVLQGESDMDTLTRLQGWTHRMNCYIDAFLNAMQTNFGRTFQQTIIGVMRRESTTQISGGTDRFRSELSSEMIDIVKNLALSRPDTFYADFHDLERPDGTHLTATGSGVVAAQRMHNVARNRQNFPPVINGHRFDNT